MKVNDRSSLGSLEQGARTNETQRTEKESAARTGSRGIPGDGDRVELSTAGRIAGAIQSGAADRANRVSAIAAAYQAGVYQVDPLATSRGMVSEALATGIA